MVIAFIKAIYAYCWKARELREANRGKKKSPTPSVVHNWLKFAYVQSDLM